MDLLPEAEVLETLLQEINGRWFIGLRFRLPGQGQGGYDRAPYDDIWTWKDSQEDAQAWLDNKLEGLKKES